jgi:acyl-CoA thioester hydrolase
MADARPPERDELPSVVVHRRVEWQDTDAAGHHHHGAVLRWVESAETVLLLRRGATALFGRTPRVHYDVDYRSRLWYGQIVRIELAVARVGEKSVRYTFQVRGDDVVAASGSLVTVMSAPDGPHAMPLPSEIRLALTTGGPQEPETMGAPAPVS